MAADVSLRGYAHVCMCVCVCVRYVADELGLLDVADWQAAGFVHVYAGVRERERECVCVCVHDLCDSVRVYCCFYG